MKKEQDEIDKEILRKIDKLEDKLLEKKPSHFRKRDVVNATFGSLLFGLPFISKGLLLDISLKLSATNLFWIIVCTAVMLSVEIYYIAYSRVPKSDRPHRHFGQFWLKRFTTIYGIAILTSLFLVYLYGINSLAGSFENIVKIVVATSFPCAVGAAVPSLLKQF